MAAADSQVRIEMLERALHWAQLTIQKKDAEIQLLQERLRKQRIGFLGPSSETLSDLQLELLTEEEPSVAREEVEAESRLIGYDSSEVLDREPAKWFVRVTKREKRSCGKCSAIQMPPLAPRIMEKGLASDRVIIETVVAKYCDHLPLYRQAAMIEREAGVEISRATLGDASGRVAGAGRGSDAPRSTRRILYTGR